MRLKIITAFIIYSIGYYQAAAQEERDIYLQIGPSDATKYLERYLGPVFNGIGYGFTSGWYTTAETHDKFGFDITITGNVAFIPSEERTFLFKNSDFSNIQLSAGNEGAVPTFFGPQNIDDRVELTVLDDDGESLVRVTAPPGAINMKQRIGFNAVPVPMFQVGVGLFKKTDLKIRWVPKLTFDGTSVAMFGLGVQHDVAQWVRRLAVKDVSISVLAAFNGLKAKTDLSYGDDPQTRDNQGVFQINGFNLQVIGSKEYIDLITIFGGVGYSRAGSRIRVLGTFPVDESFEELPPDPIDFTYGNNSLNLSMGITVKLLFITATVCHTIQTYQVTTLGLGVSVR